MLRKLLLVGLCFVVWVLFSILLSFVVCHLLTAPIRNTKFSWHTLKTMDNNPSLFPLYSSLEVKRNWNRWKNPKISKTPLEIFFLIAFGFITRSPHFPLGRCSAKKVLTRIHCIYIAWNWTLLGLGREEVASSVLLLLYFKCPNAFDLYCKESRAWRFRG